MAIDLLPTISAIEATLERFGSELMIGVRGRLYPEKWQDQTYKCIRLLRNCLHERQAPWETIQWKMSQTLARSWNRHKLSRITWWILLSEKVLFCRLLPWVQTICLPIKSSLSKTCLIPRQPLCSACSSSNSQVTKRPGWLTGDQALHLWNTRMICRQDPKASLEPISCRL